MTAKAVGRDLANVVARVPRLARRSGLELSARRVLEGMYAGRHRSPFHGSSMDFAEHRPYQPGDELRSIDWRAFGRTDRLLIRRYQDDRQLPLAVVLDSSASMAYGKPAKDDIAKLAAAALALMAIDQGDTVQVMAGANSAHWTPALSSASAAGRACETLFTSVSRGTADLAKVMQQVGDSLRRRTLVVLLSDLLTEVEPLAEVAAAMAARGHEVAVIQVLDRSEIDLPTQWGRVTLKDPEGSVPEFTCDAGRAKVAYDLAMAAHMDHCRNVLSAARADHLLLVSDEDVAQALGTWLAQRRRR